MSVEFVNKMKALIKKQLNQPVNVNDLLKPNRTKHQRFVNGSMLVQKVLRMFL